MNVTKAHIRISEDDAFGKSVERLHTTVQPISRGIETYDNWVTSENGCEGYYDQSSLGTYKVKYMATSGGCEKYFSVSIMMGWDGNEWEPVTRIVNELTTRILILGPLKIRCLTT